jgi:hypothetical protein
LFIVKINVVLCKEHRECLGISVNLFILYALYLTILETLISPSSRKKRLISPIIKGTAYVENFTL